MKLKSLILGSAALLAVVNVAHAADLPAAAEPVEYVKVCDAFGSGFFYIPGTQTCLKIGGQVRADFAYADHLDGVNDRSFNNFRTRARGYLFLETNTQSDIGLIHTYVEERMTLDSKTSSGDASSTASTLQNAFVDIISDFGTFTAGRANSYFDVYGTDAFNYVLGGDDPTNPTNLVAYKFALGGSFYAAVSLEDAASSPSPYRRASTNLTNDFNYGGQELPDLVASIGAKSGWGAAQIMGVLHEVRSNRSGDDNELGWAVGAGLSAVKIPHSIFSVGGQVTYGEGTTGYVTTGNGGPLADARYDADGDIDLTKAWSVRGGITANLTKTWQAVLTGSYADVDHYGDAYDYKTYSAAAQLDWKPVAGLLIGAEVEYENVDGKSGYLASNLSGDVWGGTLRVQRKF